VLHHVNGPYVAHPKPLPTHTWTQQHVVLLAGPIFSAARVSKTHVQYREARVKVPERSPCRNLDLIPLPHSTNRKSRARIYRSIQRKVRPHELINPRNRQAFGVLDRPFLIVTIRLRLVHELLQWRLAEIEQGKKRAHLLLGNIFRNLTDCVDVLSIVY